MKGRTLRRIHDKGKNTKKKKGRARKKLTRYKSAKISKKIHSNRHKEQSVD